MQRKNLILGLIDSFFIGLYSVHAGMELADRASLTGLLQHFMIRRQISSETLIPCIAKQAGRILGTLVILNFLQDDRKGSPEEEQLSDLHLLVFRKEESNKAARAAESNVWSLAQYFRKQSGGDSGFPPGGALIQNNQCW